MLRAVVVAAVAIAAAACRTATTQTASTQAEASTGVAVEVADAHADAAALAGSFDASDAAELRPAVRALPSAERLVAPFHGTKAHGFVAMTNLDRRTSAAIVRGESIDLAKPVLVASF